jgi:hypothetical protein
MAWDSYNSIEDFGYKFNDGITVIVLLFRLWDRIDDNYPAILNMLYYTQLEFNLL